MSSENVITIKLEIEIPVGADVGVPRVITTATGRERPKTRSLSHVIHQPAGSSLCRWDGTQGWVCASGQALENSVEADRVKVIVYPGFYSGGSAVAADPTATTISALNGAGEWGPVEISGVMQHPTNGINHTFVSWAEWPDGTTTRTSNTFTTLWSAYSGCDAVSVQPPHGGQTNQAIELLPAAWQVNLRGFYGTPLSRLNGEWRLRLAGPSRFPIVFCSGGDGVKQPRVQLRCESLVSPVWELVLEAGGCHVTYTCPGQSFDSQRRSVFQNACGVGIGEDVSIPAMISVVPA